MSDLAIQVENLSKRYRLGPHQRYRTLRESLTAAIASPLRRWRDRRPMTDDGSPGLPSPVPRPSQFSPASSVSGQPSEDGYIWALKDVSFSVKHGEVLGIIGRNGAGKSTLLKILSRITKPTEGRAVVNGRVGSLLEVGTGFHPELTGRENVYLNGAILGMKRAELERTFDEIVAFAEVEKFIDTPVKHYSSGMYVRLAFAVAAHLEPEILLVDEVLAVGDAEFQRKCLGRMSEVTKEGRTVLFVSHNMASVARLCTSGLWLADGHCAYWGSSPDAINRYLASGTSAGLAHVDLRKAPGWDSQRRVILTSVTTKACGFKSATA
jgi:lipopolysaccharide transport system ATP-binding protein